MMRSSSRAVALVILGAAPGAFAGGGEAAVAELVGLLGISVAEISCKVSTEATTSSSNGQSVRRAECDHDRDCHASYQCGGGRCLAQAEPEQATAAQPLNSVSSTAVERPAAADRCGVDTDCPTGMGCSYSTCAPLAPVPVAAPPERCVTNAECGMGRSCADHQCHSAPPAPSSSLQRRGSELYLRARAVELREELALGRGPVINGLAAAEGVPAKELGRALREHRAELIALIGDGSDASWSARFLNRVDQLSGHAS